MKQNRVWNRVCIPWFLVAALFVAGEAFGGMNGSKISISGKIKTEKSRDKGEDEVETETENTITIFKTETENCTLQVKIENAAEEPVTGQLEWCFISDYSSGKVVDRNPEDSVPAVFSPGKKEITLAAGAVVDETIISEPFVYEEKTVEIEKYTGNGNTTSKDYETGNVYKGYLVLFTVNGEVVALASNTSSYKKDKWIDLCRNPPSAPKKGKKKKGKKKK